MNDKKYILWADFIRVIATFLMVMLHSVAPLLSQYNEQNCFSWWTGNIIDSGIRICVPLFFMLSGYLLVGKDEKTEIFFRKRLKRIILPFLTWSFFYTLWKVYVQKSEILSFHSFYNILFAPAYFHMWFMYSIIGIYLYIPIFRKIILNSDNVIIYYFIGLWFLAVSIIPFHQKLTGIYNFLNLKMISGFIGYLAIGYVLGRKQLSRKIFIINIISVLIGTGVTAAASFYFTIKNGGIFDEYFYDYLSPNVVWTSVSGFIVLKYIAENISFMYKKNSVIIIKSISSVSFGIYFVHIIFLNLLSGGYLGYPINAFWGNPLYSVPLTALLAFILSFVFIFILSRIPVVRTAIT